MGEEGARQTQRSADAAAAVVADLAPLGKIGSRKMFGGHGIFGDGVMFALVDSSGTVHLRADAGTEARFLDAGSTTHGRMPYWVVPPAVLASEARFVTWASEALEIAKAAKR